MIITVAIIITAAVNTAAVSTTTSWNETIHSSNSTAANNITTITTANVCQEAIQKSSR